MNTDRSELENHTDAPACALLFACNLGHLSSRADCIAVSTVGGDWGAVAFLGELGFGYKAFHPMLFRNCQALFQTCRGLQG